MVIPPVFLVFCSRLLFTIVVYVLYYIIIILFRARGIEIRRKLQQKQGKIHLQIELKTMKQIL